MKRSLITHNGSRLHRVSDGTLRSAAPAVLLLLAFTVLAAPPLAAQDESAYNINAGIIINSGSRDGIIEWVASQGGYYILNSTTQLSLRLPMGSSQQFREVLDGFCQRVLNYDVSSENLAAQIYSVQAAIVSRQETLQRNLSYLDKADVTGTLALEREIGSLISEIEYYKGQLKVLDNRAAYAYINISLMAPAPHRPESGTSSFPWLRKLDFYRFIQEDL